MDILPVSFTNQNCFLEQMWDFSSVIFARIVFLHANSSGVNCTLLDYHMSMTSSLGIMPGLGGGVINNVT